MDIFSLPEMALLSCVVDYFLGHGLEFDQVHLYKDVTVRSGDCPLAETKPVCDMVGLPHCPPAPTRMPSGMCM